MQKQKVAFVCVHNSCRSQMAEGWTRNLGAEVVEVYSAGTETYPQVNPLAVEVMREAGIDIRDQYPKLLDQIPERVDILIKMGCNVVCPHLPSDYVEDWGLEDPSGGTIEDFRLSREQIKSKVIDLINRIKTDSISKK